MDRMILDVFSSLCVLCVFAVNNAGQAPRLRLEAQSLKPQASSLSV